jgi:hypothetical protein
VAFGGHDRQIDLALADGLTFAARRASDWLPP